MRAVANSNLCRKDPLVFLVRSFLLHRFVPGQRLLLGFSGGGDSTALLHLLLKNRALIGDSVLLAHVDHGWRPESGKEAEKLKEIAENLRIKFYLNTLDKGLWGLGSGEAVARKERLHFFAQLYREHGCQALVLAHHAEDQAETVLKRIFEGASLGALKGLEEETQCEGMVVWRPLLKVRKQTLVQWMQQEGISWLEDPTNRDSRYLRSRMRMELFPELARLFGKEITQNLCLLGERSRELAEYLRERSQGLLEGVHREGERLYWDLRRFLPLQPPEFESALRDLLHQKGIALSREQIATLFSALNGTKAKRQISERVYVDRGVISIF